MESTFEERSDILKDIKNDLIKISKNQIDYLETFFAEKNEKVGYSKPSFHRDENTGKESETEFYPSLLSTCFVVTSLKKIGYKLKKEKK